MNQRPELVSLSNRCATDPATDPAIAGVPSKLVMMPILVPFLMLILTLGGCSGSSTAEPSYFPLNRGWSWTYKVRTVTNKGSTSSELQVTNLGSVALTDQISAVERRNSQGNSYYFVANSNAVTRVASKNELDSQARIDQEDNPRHVMTLPIKLGTQWSLLTRLYLLHKPMDFPQEMKYGRPIPITFEVEAIDETVTVPAGTFNQCVVITGHRMMKMLTDPVAGFEDIPINQKEWYCPNVGLVKFIRAEIIDGRWISGGTYTMELTKLKR
jgi:hypothetical protein